MKNLKKTPIVAKKPVFKHQILRDLDWLCTSPSLIKTDKDFIETQKVQALQQHFESNNSLLDTIFKNIKSTVGDYFERLVLLWLSLDEVNQDITHNIKLFEGKRTIGELDFLYFDSLLKTSIHLEVAIKYYLWVEKNGSLQFVGPNTSDTLLRKYHKMRNQQMCLSETEAASHLTLIASHPSKARGLMKGYLFYPRQNGPLNSEDIPSFVNPEHLRGWWSHISTLDLSDTGNNFWLVLNKPFWLALPENIQPMSRQEIESFLQSHFQKRKQAVLLAELVQENQQWVEKSRGFVVSNEWPK